MDTQTDVSNSTAPAWTLDWLSVTRCRLILLLLLSMGFLFHLRYLHYNCPIDLSGDEAQYWDWSRSLDWSYYSKGPLVAYIIRASCAVFGDTMPAVRYPALVLAVLTSIVTYLLTRKLFGSERLALGAVALFHLVPMFIAGSVLMTIDPPMFFCWALATYLAAIAILDGKRWIWPMVGAAIGLGFLAKYAAMLWFVGLFGFLLTERPRRHLAGGLAALLVAGAFTMPVIVWNIQHGWVSFRHVARQTGAAGGAFAAGNVLEMLAGQIGAVGPTMAVLMVGAVVFALRKRAGVPESDRRKLRFLLWIGIAFLACNLLAALRSKVQVNWPAPAYFTLLVVTAYFLSNRLGSLQTWKPWRGWFYATVVIALIVTPIAHDTSLLYPILRPLSERLRRNMDDLDPLARLRGWEELGVYVAQERAKLDEGAFILCDDYMQTAQMAFYVPGRPKTYCAGSYFGKRLSQYDIWEDRRLDPQSPQVGHDAVYVGKGGRLPPAVAQAFGSVERLPELPIIVDGVVVKTFKVWRCRNFRGMLRPAELDY